jgi:ribosomal protein S18 acetylase RimI-like enzyme
MIALRPMTPEEFQRYLEPAIASYARVHKRAGNLSDRQAMARARRDYRELLPKGVKSPRQFLHSILRDGKAIGMTWIEVRRKHGRKEAFIFDIKINPSQRGKGLGRKALRALERQAKRLGAQMIRLNVFGHNLRARALYETSGYRYTSMHMSKPLR